MDADYIFEHYENPYLVLSIVEHQSVLQKIGDTVEYKDYLYMGKNVTVCKCNNYCDFYGNEIEGKVENVQVEMSCGSSLKIEPGAKIGKNVKIVSQLFSEVIISEGVCIKDNVTLIAKEQSKIFIGKNVTLENNCYIKAMAHSEVDLGVDMENAEEKTEYIEMPYETILGYSVKLEAKYDSKIRIGKRCALGHNLEIISTHGKHVDIGNDCLLSWYITILGGRGHSIFDFGKGKHVEKSNVEVKQHVWIGMHANIIGGTVLNKNCIVGANSLTNKEYKANSMLAGQPARCIKEEVSWDYKSEMTYEEFMIKCIRDIY